MKNKREVRPTTNIIKKSLFDILGDIRGFSFLDLFAGKGTVGLEALRREAAEVVFIDNNISLIEELKKRVMGFNKNYYEIIKSDVFRAIKIMKARGKIYNIIFLDPPYYKNLAKKALKVLADYDILAPEGFIIVQHYIKEKLPDKVGSITLVRQKRYGQNMLSFYCKKDTLIYV